MVSILGLSQATEPVRPIRYIAFGEIAEILTILGARDVYRSGCRHDGRVYERFQ